MANISPSRVGQQNAAGDALAQFLKVFSGEVLTAFAESNIMFNGSAEGGSTHLVRSITSGKSAQFPASWKATAAYHTPGNELTGQAIKHNERIINVDGLLTSSVFLANIDEAMNHYDVRSEYTFQLGQSLAIKGDKYLLQLIALAARAATTVEDGNGGSQLTNAGYDTTPDTLADGIMDAAQALDEKDVPETDRYCVLRPKHYNLLVKSNKAINRDFGGEGSYARRKVFYVGDIRILKSNHVPNSNIAQDSGTNNTYHADFSNTVGLVFHRSAVGTVKLMDLAVEHEYEIRRQGTLFVAKYAMGHGILRPEAAVEMKKA